MTTHKSKSPLTCAVYRRISEDRNRNRFGVQTQEQTQDQMAAVRGWAIDPDQIYEDNDIGASGRSTEAREEFERLLIDMAAGRIARLIVTEWPRIERNREDAYRFMKAAIASRMLVVLNGIDIDIATSQGQLTADVLSATARHEINQKEERAKAARERRLSQGQRAGGARPFGYTLAMVPIEAEADAVREAYRRVINRESLGSIARWLNAEGLLTPRGRQWEPGNLGQALRKGTYCGLLEHKGKTMGDGAWTALIDRGLWESAQAVLRHPDRLRHGGTVTQALLTGAALCGLCGDGTTVHAGGTGGPRSSPIYRCSRVAHLSIQRAAVDQYVLGEVADLIGQIELIETGGLTITDTSDQVVSSPTTDQRRRRPAPVPHGSLNPGREIEDLEKQLDELADDLTINQRVLLRRTAAIDARIAELREEIADAELAEVPVSSLADVIELGSHDDYRAAFLAAAPEAQRRAIRAIATVTINAPGRGARGLRSGTVIVN